MGLKLHVLTRPPPPHCPITPGRATGTQDTRGTRRHEQLYQIRKPVPLLMIALVMKPFRVWENPRRWTFVRSKVGMFLTWDLGTCTAQHLGTHLGFRKSLSGNTEIQAAYQSCFLLCLLLWVFHFSVNHRQSLKLMAGWKSLARFANTRL